MDVQLPDGTTVRGVPDGTSKADLFAKLKANGHPVDDSWLGTSAPKTPEQSPQNMTAFVGGNLSKGLADVAGLPVDLAHSAIEGTKGLANLGGAKLKETQAPVGGSEWIKQKLSQIGSISQSAEPRTPGQRIVAAGLEAVPSAVLPGGGAKALPRIGAAVGGGVGGEVGRQIGGTPGQLAGSLVGGGLGGMAGAEKGIPKPPSEAARASQESGIPLTIGQETGSKAITSIENRLRELFPSKGTAHADELKQVTAGANRVTELADRLSAPQGVPGELLETNIGEKLRFAYQNTVKKIDSLRDTNATRDYGEVRKLAGDKPVIGYQNTMDTLDKIIAENTNVPSADAKKVAAQAESIKKALTVTTPGAPASKILAPSGAPAIPAAPATTGAATHTINDAMKTRSAWGRAARRSGNIFSDIDPTANQMLAKRLFGAINKDFESASTAQTPVAQALKAANQNYAKASQSLTFIEKSALGKLLGEDVADAAFTGVQGSTKAPEAIAKKYLSMTPSQAKSVTAILQLHQPEVLQDAKAFVLRNGLEAAKNTAPGAPPISFAKFRKEMDRVQPKLAQMGFSKKDIADIKDVTDTMARAGDRAGMNPSGTAAAGHMLGTASIAFAHPMAAAASVLTPYIASKALLTSKGRDLLRAAIDSKNGKAQAAAIGALRSAFQEPSKQSGAQPPPAGAQLASPPQ
jgi:hypothetical protein